MKTKLEMAHDYTMLHMMNTQYKDVDDLEMIQWAFDYADAMKAEADKRSVYGENWDKEKGGQKTFVSDAEQDHTWAGEEWQPDWSQAPEWAKFWVATANQSGKITGGWFYEDEPEFGLRDNPSAYISVGCRVVLTDSFGYKGDWRDSLRKRPN